MSRFGPYLIGAAGALALCALVGCNGGGSPAPVPTDREVSVEPLPPGESLPPESTPREAPPAPTGPAAITAGPLTPEDLPTELLGFGAEYREPAEGEYIPNGTWTHEVEGGRAAYEAMPSCAGNSGGGWPDPTFALAGTYLDDQQRPGNGLLLQFADDAAARDYYDVYVEVLRSCPSTDGLPSAEEIADGADWYGGRRDYAGEKWSEVVAVDADRVALVIVNDDHESERDALQALGEELSGD